MRHWHFPPPPLSIRLNTFKNTLHLQTGRVARQSFFRVLRHLADGRSAHLTLAVAARLPREVARSDCRGPAASTSSDRPAVRPQRPRGSRRIGGPAVEPAIVFRPPRSLSQTRAPNCFAYTSRTPAASKNLIPLNLQPRDLLTRDTSAGDGRTAAANFVNLSSSRHRGHAVLPTVYSAPKFVLAAPRPNKQKPKNRRCAPINRWSPACPFSVDLPGGSYRAAGNFRLSGEGSS